ncbi:hypothetical protein [Aestuariibius sp. HNIBRBA575]|uniref:hypothetical protein n=1 Tax=Aestuariibius sp. HNIBRBA575 TaxID=3233343 RepID=UPI0034A22046
MGWKLFKHAFQMVTGNLHAALRATLVPMLILAGMFVLIIMGWDQSLGQPSPVLLFLVPAILIMCIVLFPLIAITWHRYVLKEEFPRWIPRLGDKRIGAYFWTSVLIGLILMIPSMIISTIVSALFWASLEEAALNGQQDILQFSISGVLAGILMGTLAGFLWMRCALCLPAIALNEDENFGIGASWSKTSGVSKDVLVFAFFLAVLNVAASFVPIMIGQVVVRDILSIVINWFTFMIGLSALTTLYGHLVEKRPLID